MTIENLLGYGFFQGDNKKYFIRNNADKHYGMHYFVNCMIQRRKRSLYNLKKKKDAKQK